LNSGRGVWSAATKVDFWSGLGLVVVGLATILLYRMNLAQDLVEAGIISRQPSLEAASPQEEASLSAQSPDMTDAALLALATSVVQDIQKSEGLEQPVEPSPSSTTGLATHEQSPVKDEDLVRLASSLLAEIQRSPAPETPAPEDTEGTDTPEATPELMSESELARMAAELLQEIQRTSVRETTVVGEEHGHE
jgi:hypothetical protein